MRIDVQRHPEQNAERVRERAESPEDKRHPRNPAHPDPRAKSREAAGTPGKAKVRHDGGEDSAGRQADQRQDQAGETAEDQRGEGAQG